MVMSRWLVAAVEDPERLMDSSIDGMIDKKCTAAVNEAQ